MVIILAYYRVLYQPKCSKAEEEELKSMKDKMETHAQHLKEQQQEKLYLILP